MSLPFTTVAKLVINVRKPKTYVEFVHMMAEAQPHRQNPAEVKKAWEKLSKKS